MEGNKAFQIAIHAPGVESRGKIAKKNVYNEVNDHWYNQAHPDYPVVTCQWLCLVKYFHHVLSDKRLEIQSYRKTTKPHLREGSGRGTHRRRCLDFGGSSIHLHYHHHSSCCNSNHSVDLNVYYFDPPYSIHIIYLYFL
jgi:hypothetical protein